MHFFERHIGDYATSAGHLTMIEDGAYQRLLDRYYASEAPIPADQAYRVARARSEDEREAVDVVLREFFFLEDGAWRHSRCDEAIAKYQSDEPARTAKRENAKNRQQRARQERQQLFDELRQHGESPAFDTQTATLRAMLSRHLSRVTSRVTSEPVTRDDTATNTQEPRTTELVGSLSQVPDSYVSTSDERDGDQGWAALPMREKRGGLVRLLGRNDLPISPMEPAVTAAAAAGVTPEELLAMIGTYPGKGAAYVLRCAISQRERIDAARSACSVLDAPFAGPIQTKPPNTSRTALALYNLQSLKSEPTHETNSPARLADG